jgi:hypothetical protein
VSFSHGARIIAILGVVIGALRVLMGLAIANGWGGLSADDLSRYTTAATTGEVIDKGIYVVIAAVALGTLAEIGLTSRKNSRGQ